MYILNLDTYEQAKSITEKKNRLRCVAVDYCEKKEERKKRSQTQRRPRSEHETIRQQIKIKIERISNIKKALNIHNQQRDKMQIQDVDLEEIDELLDETEDEMPSDIVEIEAGHYQLAQNDGAADDLIEIGSHAGIRTNTISTGIDPIQVDNTFSVEYSFTVDVSFFFVICLIDRFG